LNEYLFAYQEVAKLEERSLDYDYSVNVIKDTEWIYKVSNSNIKIHTLPSAVSDLGERAKA
jgi:hypothetical protein